MHCRQCCWWWLWWIQPRSIDRPSWVNWILPRLSACAVQGGVRSIKYSHNPLQSRIVINNSFNPPTLFRSKKASSAVKGLRQIDVSTLTRRRRLRSEGSLAAKTRRIDLSALKNKLCSYSAVFSHPSDSDLPSEFWLAVNTRIRCIIGCAVQEYLNFIAHLPSTPPHYANNSKILPP